MLRPLMLAGFAVMAMGVSNVYAGATDKLFDITVESTVSGEFGAELAFLDDKKGPIKDTFVIRPDGGEDGQGKYEETDTGVTVVTKVTGTGSSPGYVGKFTAVCIDLDRKPAYIFGFGFGSAFDLFFFSGVERE